MLRRRSPLKRKALSSRKALQRKTAIRPVGRVTRYRAKRKEQWIHDHPPDENGYYICHICHKPVHISVMRLDHVLNKGSTPKAIAEADENLGPSHEVCYNEKGST